ncbi:hypothetical protein Q8F55_002634 [Vanrija albida]|uniref:BRO1 domain-containing protein n=1 Tax=Vanrija albida TaxID=181172 RepID=A0ABR3QAC2_9TREE
MPPRLPAKRRNEESPAGRSSKKVVKELTYDTYDEAFDGGVEHEEKGERYKDGEKAQRFYEKAAELYQKAMQFGETYDATFNLARVQYTLASQFYLPPSSLDIYGSAIALYRNAMDKAEDPNLKSDAAFNLSQALLSLAELTEEYEGPAAAGGVKELRDLAMTLLQTVFMTQSQYLEFAKEHPGEVPDGTGEEGEAPPADAEGDAEMKEGEDEDEDATPSGSPPAEGVTAVTYPTPSAFVDTVMTFVDTQSTLWEAAEPVVMPTENAQEASKGVLGYAESLAPPGRQAELTLAEMKLLLTLDSINWELTRKDAKPGSGQEKGLEGAARALTALLANLDASPPDDPSVRADILSTLADTEMEAATRLIIQAKAGPAGPSPQAQSAWAHLTSATATFGKALDLPSLGTQAEFRPHILMQLVRTSLNRARLAPINDTAQRNQGQLLDNCAAYAHKAAQALGWQYPPLPKREGWKTPVPAPGKLEPPFPAGWDAELLARTLALLQLRVCYFVHSGQVLDGVEGAKEKYGDETAKPLVETLQSVPPGPRRIGPRDIERFVGDVEDEEGPLSEGESQWWAEIAAKFVADDAGQQGLATEILNQTE